MGSNREILDAMNLRYLLVFVDFCLSREAFAVCSAMRMDTL